MMKREYDGRKEIAKTDVFDCSTKYFSTEVLTNFSSWKRRFQPDGYRFTSIEPSHAFAKFPYEYHQSTIAQVLLNESLGELHTSAWRNMAHVLVIRAPLEMAVSAFNYRFPSFPKTIHEQCLDVGMTTDECVHEMFRVAENSSYYQASSPLPHPLFNAAQLWRIKHEILGNYSINHFSLNNDLESAKATFRKFHVILDLTMSSVATQLLVCALGWSAASAVKKNVNSKHPASQVLEALGPGTVQRWRHFLRHDSLLYGAIVVATVVTVVSILT